LACKLLPRPLAIVLTDGELVWDEQRKSFDPDRSTALPSTLTEVFRSEPLYCDFRWAQKEEFANLSGERYADAVGTIAATLHGIEKSAIVGKDLAEHKKTMRLARAAIVGLTGLSVIALILALFANRQRLTAERNMRTATARGLSAAAI
jgi:hypothetical protein